MSDANRVEAARAFAALCAFDPNLAERTELLSSGVSEHRVNILYGRQYPALIPGLISHLEQVAIESLPAPGSIRKLQVDDTWTALPDVIFDIVLNDNDFDILALRECKLEGKLSKSIEACFGFMQNNLDADNFQIAAGVWGAYWQQVHYNQLPPENQVLADDLMVAVARTIGL